LNEPTKFIIAFSATSFCLFAIFCPRYFCNSEFVDKRYKGSIDLSKKGQSVIISKQSKIIENQRTIANAQQKSFNRTSRIATRNEDRIGTILEKIRELEEVNKYIQENYILHGNNCSCSNC
jgi:hypothetical protein